MDSPLHTHRLSPRHYNRKHFHENNIDEITILHHNLDRFSVFFFQNHKMSPESYYAKSFKNLYRIPFHLFVFFGNHNI